MRPCVYISLSVRISLWGPMAEMAGYVRLQVHQITLATEMWPAVRAFNGYKGTQRGQVVNTRSSCSVRKQRYRIGVRYLRGTFGISLS